MHKTLMLMACLLAGCANACDDNAGDAKRGAQSSTQASEAAPMQARPPVVVGAEMVPDDKLATLCKDKLGRFAASGEARRVSSALPSGHALPQARRTYRAGETTLELEVMDALYAPTVRELVKQAQNVKRESPTSVMMGLEFKGNPAIKQWTEVNQTARVGAVVADRLIVNISVSPAQSVDEAVAAAEAFDYAGAAALLAATKPGAAKPSDAGTRKSLDKNAALPAAAVQAAVLKEEQAATKAAK